MAVKHNSETVNSLAVIICWHRRKDYFTVRMV